MTTIAQLKTKGPIAPRPGLLCCSARRRPSGRFSGERLAANELRPDQKVAAAAQGTQRAVEVDARGDQGMQRRGIAHDAAQDGGEVDLAVRLDGCAGDGRQRTVGGVADDADRGERQAGKN